MTEQLFCLDTSVVLKALTNEEPYQLSAAASRLLRYAASSGRLIAPSFAWAEMGSVLRKKLRQGLMTDLDVSVAWELFCALPIEHIQTNELRDRAWEIARRYALPTLYDAAFLACIEILNANDAATAEYWTADAQLLRQLGAAAPSYVRALQNF